MPCRVHLADPGRKNALLVLQDPDTITRAMATGWTGSIDLTSVDRALLNVKVSDIVAVQPMEKMK